MSATDSLFASFALKSLHTDNRIVMAPMTRGMSPDNTPSDASVDYYRRRAAGGVGLTSLILLGKNKVLLVLRHLELSLKTLVITS